MFFNRSFHRHLYSVRNKASTFFFNVSRTIFFLNLNVRWLKPTAKNIALNEQFSRSELYPLPFTLVNGHQDISYPGL